MSQLADLIYTDLIHALRDSNSCMNDRQAHAVCLAISHAFSPDRPDAYDAGRQAERTRTLALIALRLEQLQAMPSHRKQIAELLVLRSLILESDNPA